MEWIEPKTNWRAAYDQEGNYIGDYFCVDDYSRIKNNLMYLKELALKMYPYYVSVDMDLLGYEDYFYASIINKLEINIDNLVLNTFAFTIAPTKRYKSNDPFLLFSDLNRIESTLLYIYSNFTGQWNGAITLEFTCGGDTVQC